MTTGERIAAAGVTACLLLTGCDSLRAGRTASWGIADPPPILQGRVTDAGGAPLFGVTVDVFAGPGPSWFPLATVQTDPDGCFRVCLGYGGGHYDPATGRRADISVGLVLKHPRRADEAKAFDWAGRIPNASGYHAIGDLSIRLAPPKAEKN